MTQGWWTVDNAAVAVYYWGGTGTTWPGDRMQPVLGETGIWYADIDATKVTGLIFTRVNPSGPVTDWGAKTKDLTIPADGRNLYTITSTSAVWGDPGCDGVWSKYEAPEEPETSVKFFVTGDSALVVDAGYGLARKWNADAIPSEKDTILLALQAGVDYSLKVTVNGTWSTARGYDDLTEKADGLSADDDGNIHFTLKTAGNVRVIYTGEVFKLKGDFVKPCKESYGLMIDGVYLAGQRNDLQTEWTEYMLRNVELTQGQRIKVHSVCADATWVIERFAPTSYVLPIEDGAYVVEESGKYDFYIKFVYGNDEMYISKEGTYTTAVRNQCTDVMMQAFFNESYNDHAPGVGDDQYHLKIGNTRWATLIPQAEEIGHSFDLIWLPPSANGDGMGYHPRNYADQNSNWGTREELNTLIDALHDAGSKVVADIVINHCTGNTTWCNFPVLDFGEYGTFYPDASYICRNDEVNSEWNKDAAGDCYGAATGSYDDGENWEGARDWAHNDVQVQNMFKAYLKWLRTEIGYDGFRYDKGDGFNNWHHDNYNKAASPYIAFMECYSNTDVIKGRIEGANYNLMGLDFDTKWHVFDSFAGWNFARGRGEGLLGQNWGRYSVTFIDSHDWFLRSDNENEFGGRGNSLTETLKPRLLMANAFMLSMPGVPCVFYPHWAKYKEFIKLMIAARKLAGVHSESEVKDEYVNATGYQATIVGKDGGYLILCLGDKAHQDFNVYGYQLIASYYAENDANSGHDASYQMWVLPKEEKHDTPTRCENTDATVPKAEKQFRNGRLYIRVGDMTYDVMGNRIK